MKYGSRCGHIGQCTHFLHKLLQDGVPALLLLEGLAEVEEGDAWPVTPEVRLQTAWHHWNTLIHQIKQQTMIWRWRVTERVLYNSSFLIFLSHHHFLLPSFPYLARHPSK